MEILQGDDGLMEVDWGYLFLIVAVLCMAIPPSIIFLTVQPAAIKANIVSNCAKQCNVSVNYITPAEQLICYKTCYGMLKEETE